MKSFGFFDGYSLSEYVFLNFNLQIKKMATITLGGNEVHTLGSLPEKGSKAPDFEMTNIKLSTNTLNDFLGKKLVLNIFPSVNTGVCAASVRNFNQKAGSLPDTTVLCISRDLPFAQEQFCGAEGIENVVMLSDYRDHKFGKDYGLEMTDGIFDSLLSRVVLILNEAGEVIYSEQVPEIGQEPDYDSAIKALGA